MQADVHPNDKNGERVNPSTADSQVELLNEVKESTSKNSLDFGTKVLTISAGSTAVVGAQPCRTVYVSATAKVNVGNAANGDADAASFYIPKDIVIEIPVRNTNKLSFFSAAGATVHIMWRD